MDFNSNNDDEGHDDGEEDEDGVGGVGEGSAIPSSISVTPTRHCICNIATQIPLGVVEYVLVLILTRHHHQCFY